MERPVKRFSFLYIILGIIVLMATIFIVPDAQKQNRKRHRKVPDVQEQNRKIDEQREAFQVTLAKQKKEKERSNKHRLSEAYALANSGKFIMAYKTMSSLPDSIINKEKRVNITESALRQSIQNLDLKWATKILSAVPLGLERRAVYAQAVEALNRYTEVSQRLSSIEKMEDYKYGLEDILREDCGALYRSGYIKKRYSEVLYEAITASGDPFIVITTYTEFASTGSFSLYIEHIYDEPMKLNNGFTKLVPWYKENSDCTQLAQKIQVWKRERFGVKEEKALAKKEKSESWQKFRRLAQDLGLPVEVASTRSTTK